MDAVLPAPASGGALAGASPVTPGYCSDHPNQPLVPHRRVVGHRWYFAEDPAVCCPMPEHDLYDRDRCAWCGGRLVPPGTWDPSPRRAYCSPRHRLYAFRARARGDR